VTIQASLNGVVIATSDSTILVEGNHYFPPADVRSTSLEPSGATSHCTWKGDASYYHVVAGDERRDDAAWYYPEPFDAAVAIKDYIAFWKGVEVTGVNVGEPEIAPPPRRE
jgi:uncharacterized protein (DUF427 family)